MRTSPHRRTIAALLAIILALPAFFATPANAQHSDLIATAEQAGSFSTLLAALDAAGLTATVRNADDLTVLAPTDDAFAALPSGTVESLLRPENRDQLRAILLYHVIEGAAPASAVRTLDNAATLNGQRVQISEHGRTLRINDSRVVTADVRASNGIIHVIDAVLIPETKNIAGVAQEAGAFGTLLAAAEAAGLVPALTGEGPLTVFAPTDAAFAALPEGTVESLLRPENQQQLRDILLFHVTPGRLYAEDVLGARSIETLNGADLRPRLRSGVAFVNDSEITQTNIEASNGVIHVIDAVLLPPDTRGDARRMSTGGAVSPAELIMVAIDRGVPLFNRGDADACAAVYEVAALALSQNAAVPASSRRALSRATQTRGSASERAWALRDALDQTLASLESQRMRTSNTRHF